MNKQHLRRTRIHRAFESWFKKNSISFAVPLRVTKIKGKGMELHFENYPDCLSVCLSRVELAVHVNWQGEFWDMILDLEAWPYQTRNGYKCKCCWDERGESAVIFPTLEALWQDHLFDPFLKWVNEKLASARWLRISCTGDGATWATLIRNESALNKTDPVLTLLQELKRVDGTPSFEGGTEGITNWLVPLKPELV